jgi:hypothetical protein
MITRSGKMYSNPAVTTTTIAHYYHNPPPLVNPDLHKWSHPESYECFDFSNIQGGEHDVPADPTPGCLSFLEKRLLEIHIGTIFVTNLIAPPS